MAMHVAQAGLDVVLTYHSKAEAARSVVQEIEAKGRKAYALQLDTGKIDTFPDFFQQLTSGLNEHFGADKFDYLVNNAGISYHAEIGNAEEEMFDRLFNIHFKGAYFLTQQALEYMNDGGGIVNVSTGLARFAIPGYSTYASMKGAMETFTTYLAKELGGRGIRANAVAPGAMDTDFNAAAFEHNPGMKDMLANVTSLGRVGEAEDIGPVVAFLCTDASRWVTGQRLEASGGMFL